MTQPVLTVRPETSPAEVAQIMLDRRIGCVPMVDEHGKFRGIVTETDFAAKERGVPFSLLNLPQAFGESMPCEVVERVRQAAKTTVAKEIMIPR